MATQGSRLAVIAAFIGNGLIAIAKFVAAVLTGSAAMLSEAWHSVADTGNQGMLLWGMRAARRPADTAHPFGWGKESYFWSFMVAVMLFAGGAVLAIRHGIDALAESHEIENLVPSFIVLGIALVIESASFTVAYREFGHVRGSRSLWRAIRESKEAAIVVVILEDAAAVTGLLLALAGSVLVALTDNTYWDGIASLLIGGLLATVAVVLAIETKALLIGEAASRSDRVAIRSRLLAMPEVGSVGRLLTMQLGPSEVLVNVEIDFEDTLDVHQIEEATARAEDEIRTVLPGANNIFLEFRDRDRG
jgi:cation diffusion facilitator family transporter